jgi:hypothetical protein
MIRGSGVHDHPLAVLTLYSTHATDLVLADKPETRFGASMGASWQTLSQSRNR